jgi:LysM repeat protein
VYVDDPLIVELRAPEATDAAVRLRAVRPHGEAVVAELPRRGFKRGEVYWWAVPGLPSQRGRYELTVEVDAGDASAEHRGVFCRTDRPSAGFAVPVTVHADAVDPALLLAMRSLSLKQVRLDAVTPEFDAQADLARQAGMDLIVALPGDASPQALERLGALAGSVGERVLRWDIPAADPGAFGALAARLRDAGANGLVCAAVANARELDALLAQTNGVLDGIVWTAGTAEPAMLDAAHAVLRRHGIERHTIHVRMAEPADGPAFARAFLLCLASGAASVAVDGQWVIDGAPGHVYPYLNGIRHALSAREFAGTLPAGANAYAMVFRQDAQWLVAMWAAQGTASAELDLAGASGLTHRDLMYNRHALPEAVEGRRVFELSPDPILLAGTGGGVLAAAGERRAMEQARRLANDAAYRGALDAELMAFAGEVARGGKALEDRDAFLTVLRHLPRLEAALHTGQMPPETARAATAELAALMRSLCAVQQRLGERFIEALPERLAKCEEAGRMYLGGADIPPRAERLLDEVMRLAREARALEAAGLAVEADALAALAEWRARALEYAVEAAAGQPVQVASLADVLPDAPPEPDAEVSDASEIADHGEAHAMDEAGATDQGEGEPAPEPAAETPEPASGSPETVKHVVRAGDTPSGIAAKYGVPVDDLLRWNNLTRRSVLHIGDELLVYTTGAPEDAPQAAPAAPEPRTVTHRVSRGDNPSVIANKYGVALDDLLRWNTLTRRSVLRIGDELVVHLPAGR